MGWFNDRSRPGCEGYLLGLEQLTGWLAGFFGDLSYLRMRPRVDAGESLRGLVVRHVQVACECGWRSRVFLAPPGTTWSPYTISTTERAEEHARQLWHQHSIETAERIVEQGEYL